MKTAAFLAAIKRGAHFIFHSNPEVYYWAGVSVEDFQKELEYELQKTTLGISVGLVKQANETGYYTTRSELFNPYVHFGDEVAGPNLTTSSPLSKRGPRSLWKDELAFTYKICEIRPPSVEKFLDSNGLNLDISAPAVTLPGVNFRSPFDSRNTAFADEAFWGLLLLPQQGQTFVTSDTNELPSEEEMYLLRSIIVQQILGEIGGSTKFSVARKKADRGRIGLDGLKNPRFVKLLEFSESWFCTENSALSCFQSFTKDLIEEGLVDKENGKVIEFWVNDLKAVGYSDLEIPEEKSPCIGDVALEGVYFHPNVKEEEETSDDSASNVVFPNDAVVFPTEAAANVGHRQRSGKSLDIDGNYAAKQIKRLCPAVDTSNLAIYEDVHEDTLLIITFYRKEYHNIPLLEIMYRPHFKNILYCGEPDPVVDEYMAHYTGIQGKHFSFLPTHSKTGYECILGSIEMGYHVNGFLLINQDTLINSWNFKGLNPDSIWHGNEHAKAITNDNVYEIDSENGEKIMKSSIGILKALEFLEQVLLGEQRSSSKTRPRGHAHGGRGGHHSDRHGKSLDLEHHLLDDSFYASMPHDTNEKLRQLIEGAAAAGRDSHENRKRREAVEDDDIIDDLFGEESAEELELIGEDLHKRKTDVMSITEEQDTLPMLAKKEWHISLFGEIIHDVEDENVNKANDVINTNRTANGTLPVTSSHAKFRNVSELLFHPSNIDMEVMEDNHLIMDQMKNMDASEFERMIFDIQKIYKKINSKLQLWLGFVSKDGSGTGSRASSSSSSSSSATENKQKMMRELSGLQCDVSSNAEICQIVAHFFNTLEMNESDGQFKLYFDDLPIYYVPASHKDKLYLMANLFTKFHVADELAFPLLLRGLATTDNWINLRRSELIKPTERPVLSRPQDLLSDALDDIHSELDTLEAAHYLYPVDMKNEIFQNEGLRNVICRNF